MSTSIFHFFRNGNSKNKENPAVILFSPSPQSLLVFPIDLYDLCIFGYKFACMSGRFREVVQVSHFL